MKNDNTEQKYLTISEFAKLRGVSIGSLRYYEKLDVLTPAYIDPNSKYRYYLPEQLSTLDTILMCIDLDIPLKEVKNYVDEDGYMHYRDLLLRSQKAMREKTSRMQTMMELMQQAMDSMEENKKYSGITGAYTRDIGERFFLESPIQQDLNQPPKGNRPYADLFQEAQDKNMSPVFPADIIIRPGKDNPTTHFALQVLKPDFEDPRITRTPPSSCLCIQITFTTFRDSRNEIERILEENFPGYREHLIIVTNMMQEKAHYDSRCSEIQIPLAIL